MSLLVTPWRPPDTSAGVQAYLAGVKAGSNVGAQLMRRRQMEMEENKLQQNMALQLLGEARLARADELRATIARDRAREGTAIFAPAVPFDSPAAEVISEPGVAAVPQAVVDPAQTEADYGDASFLSRGGYDETAVATATPANVPTAPAEGVAVPAPTGAALLTSEPVQPMRAPLPPDSGQGAVFDPSANLLAAAPARVVEPKPRTEPIGGILPVRDPAANNPALGLMQPGRTEKILSDFDQRSKGMPAKLVLPQRAQLVRQLANEEAQAAEKAGAPAAADDYTFDPETQLYRNPEGATYKRNTTATGKYTYTQVVPRGQGADVSPEFKRIAGFEKNGVFRMNPEDPREVYLEKFTTKGTPYYTPVAPKITKLGDRPFLQTPEGDLVPIEVGGDAKVPATVQKTFMDLKRRQTLTQSTLQESQAKSDSMGVESATSSLRTIGEQIELLEAMNPALRKFSQPAAAPGNQSPAGQSSAPSFKTADEVKAAFKAGKLARSDAERILREQFQLQ